MPLKFDQTTGLIPVVVQDAGTLAVLMVGYMNEAALAQTKSSGNVTFFSRSRQRLWEKGETSGATLEVIAMSADCDADALLIQAKPKGPTCHRGTSTCFASLPETTSSSDVLDQLSQMIASRQSADPSRSYTASLFASGLKRMAQKIGEEGVETALAIANGTDQEVINESADLIYHLLVGLAARGLSFEQVIATLRDRMKPLSASSQ